MKILLLGPSREQMVHFLCSFNDEVFCTDQKIPVTKLIESNYDFIISYGYRYILSEEVINYYKNRILNLHISFLPWNRGADPNLWSFLEDSPKGVSIHYIDKGIDTGDIIAQKEIFFSDQDTLSSSYMKLTEAIEKLFEEVWPDIRVGTNSCFPQTGKGSYHHSKEKEKYLDLLTEGWDTPVSRLINIGKQGKKDE